jgi:hypothetical protein
VTDDERRAYTARTLAELRAKLVKDGPGTRSALLAWPADLAREWVHGLVQPLVDAGATDLLREAFPGLSAFCNRGMIPRATGNRRRAGLALLREMSSGTEPEKLVGLFGTRSVDDVYELVAEAFL